MTLIYERPIYENGQKTHVYQQHTCKVGKNVTEAQAKQFIRMGFPDAINIEVIGDGSEA